MKLSDTIYTTVVILCNVTEYTREFRSSRTQFVSYDYTITEDTWHQFCSTVAPIIPLEDGVCGLTKIMLGMATRTTHRAAGCALAHVKNPVRVVTRSRKTKNRLTCGPCGVEKD